MISNVRNLVKAIIVVGICVVFIWLLLWGNTIKTTYNDNTSFDEFINNPDLKIMYYHYPYSEKYDIYGSGEETIDFETLKTNADVIVKVTLNEDYKRTIYEECVLSEIVVYEVYKGNVNKGDLLNIFEPVNCMGDMIYCSEGYMPMRRDVVYILFLKELKNALYSDSKFIYIPYNITHSKYELNSTTVEVMDAELIESGKLNYHSVNSEILLSDETLVDKFMINKKTVNKLKPLY